MVHKTLLLLSTFTLGMFFGTQLAEAALIVPYWKALSSDGFFDFYITYGDGLHQFYAPLTLAATIFPTLTIAHSLLTKSKTDMLIWMMFIFTLLFFATYFVYFKEANLSFAERTLSNEALQTELIIWGYWHWTRVFFEGVAFVCGLV